MNAGDASGVTPILVASAVAIIVAVAGGLATEIGPWYGALKKPAWQPPSWVFGPVWTTIFALAVVAAVMVWRRAETPGDHALILALFGLNAVLNILWSVLFFTFKRPDWALVEVALLWLSILALILAFRTLSPISSLLLLPYLLWVSIAAFLNWTIVRLNPPFGA
jgi:translocator protein